MSRPPCRTLQLLARRQYSLFFPLNLQNSPGKRCPWYGLAYSHEPCVAIIGETVPEE